MLIINIYFKFVLIVVGLIGGIVFWVMMGVWYGIWFVILGLVMLAIYIFLGMV